MYDLLAGFEQVLLFQHTHEVHRKLSCTEFERSRFYYWFKVCFSWGTTVNFNRLWLQETLDQILSEACVLQQGQKSAHKSQHGRSSNAKQNQGHKHPFLLCLPLSCQTQLLKSNFTLTEIIYGSGKYWSSFLSFPPLQCLKGLTYNLVNICRTELSPLFLPSGKFPTITSSKSPHSGRKTQSLWLSHV